MQEARLARAPEVLEQELDGQFLLLKLGSADVVQLDAVGSDVWRLLEEPMTREHLEQAVAQGYAVARERVAADLQPLLQTLLAHGLVVEEQDS